MRGAELRPHLAGRWFIRQCCHESGGWSCLAKRCPFSQPTSDLGANPQVGILFPGEPMSPVAWGQVQNPVEPRGRLRLTLGVWIKPLLMPCSLCLCCSARGLSSSGRDGLRLNPLQ